jgi:hypothetical protein
LQPLRLPPHELVPSRWSRFREELAYAQDHGAWAGAQKLEESVARQVILGFLRVT